LLGELTSSQGTIDAEMPKILEKIIGFQVDELKDYLKFVIGQCADIPKKE